MKPVPSRASNISTRSRTSIGNTNNANGNATSGGGVNTRASGGNNNRGRRSVGNAGPGKSAGSPAPQRSSQPRSSSQPIQTRRTEIAPASYSVWVCKLCDIEFDQDEDKLVVCSRCDYAFCVSCLQMPDDQYDFLANSSADLHWYCPDCKQPALHAVRDDFEIEERCQMYFSKVAARMDQFEAQLAVKADVSVTNELFRRVEKLYGDSEGTWMNIDRLFRDVDQLQASRSGMDESVTAAYINEMDARNKRKKNVIFFNVEEEGDDIASCKEHDASVASNLISTIDESVGSVDANDCRRLGQRNASQGNQKPKPRPLRVTVASEQQRDAILKKASRLRESVASKHIAIRKDMTPMERQRHRENAKKWRAQHAQTEQGPGSGRSESLQSNGHPKTTPHNHTGAQDPSGFPPLGDSRQAKK
ncbi:uncharacterized protein LOC121426652 [Lytechinus variegatus]|uniref:uncharacterized protein LOC121426652 n=1 Tax=Lytechinus variegatus TaxID=7654 RepID=UPI001BB25AC3|nr:uncharacterized protein LOC121426652 [Lytechinus variegatus]